MPEMTLLAAINDALNLAMAKDERVVMLGEDIGKKGGVFGATAGLHEKYGDLRVMDTPLSENGILGTAVGMGLYGLRPVPEIQFLDFIYPGFDQIVSEMAKFRYRSGGEYPCPCVVRSPSGGGIKGGHYHSQSAESYFIHTPGLRVVMPSTPRDAKGMLLASIFQDDPVIFLEPKALYRHAKEEVESGYFEVELGKARLVKAGDAVTLVSWGSMVVTCEQAVAKAAEKGISVELIDLRSLLPWDTDAVIASVKKTGRCVIVHEAPKTSGFGGELSALVQERCFYSLEAPIVRVTGWDTPYPHAFEWEYFPGPQRVADALKSVMTGGR